MNDETKKKNLTAAGVEVGADIATDVALYSAISGAGKASSTADVSKITEGLVADTAEIASLACETLDIASEVSDTTAEAASEGGSTIIEAVGEFISGIFD